MKVLVTGATGFVGGAVIDRLAGSGNAEVVAVARGRDRETRGIRHVVADVAEPGALAALGAEHFDAIVHCAGLAHRFGQTPAVQFERVNVGGTRNVARFAARTGAAQLIVISSVAVYGDHGPAPVDESFECRPSGAYAVSKRMAELAAAEEFREGALLVLRPATVIGPGDPGNLARLITQIDRGRFVRVGAGENLKTFISVTDLAAAVSAALERNVSGTYNAAAAPVSVHDVVVRICGELGRALPPIVPGFVAKWPLELLGATRFGPAARARDTLRKWLSDDVYSAALFAAHHGVAAADDIIETIGREVAWISKK